MQKKRVSKFCVKKMCGNGVCGVRQWCGEKKLCVAKLCVQELRVTVMCDNDV